MLTFLQAQTQYDMEQPLMKDKDYFIFFSQMQKALLSSLYEANLLSAGEYAQCRQWLEEAEGFER